MDAIYGFLDPQDQVEVLKNNRGYNDSLDLLVPSASLNYMKDFVRDTDVMAEVKHENYGRYAIQYSEYILVILRSMFMLSG